MRISDWSSDVCSSDLRGWRQQRLQAVLAHLFAACLPAFRRADPGRSRAHHEAIQAATSMHAEPLPHQATDRQTAEVRAFKSEEHTSELQSLMRISYAVFCLKKKKNTQKTNQKNSK